MLIVVNAYPISLSRGLFVGDRDLRGIVGDGDLRGLSFLLVKITYDDGYDDAVDSLYKGLIVGLASYRIHRGLSGLERD